MSDSDRTVLLSSISLDRNDAEICESCCESYRKWASENLIEARGHLKEF